MNIIISINNINENNIYFHDPIKNTVINNGYFIRILYSDKYIISNGIQLQFLNNISHYNIQNICSIEKIILNLYNPNVKHFLKIEDQINFNINKYSQCYKDENFFIIKISGIWENQLGIGITSKILFC